MPASGQSAAEVYQTLEVSESTWIDWKIDDLRKQEREQSRQQTINKRRNR